MNTEKVILLMNLGSPDSTEVKDLKVYLTEFLMDERVIDIPYLARLLLVRGIIVPFRAKQSAAKYRTVWTKDGSPLAVYTKNQTKLLSEFSKLPVEYCMRYGSQSPQEVLQQIATKYPDAKEVVLFPLYPHYAMSSYETAVLYAQEAFTKGNYNFNLKTVKAFYNHPAYINSLALSMLPFLKSYDHLLFSYHGIPKRHLIKTDPTHAHCMKVKDCCNVKSDVHEVCYRHQVFETTRLVAEKLNIPKEKYSVSFQSRLGKDEWLQPATANQLAEFPKKGIKNLVVITPAFVSDCLETLEEINLEGRERFMHNGGESFSRIPCLNENENWIETMNELINFTA